MDCPAKRAGAGLLRALLLGDRRGLSEAQWRRLRETGTVHLVVISGLHIGLVAMVLFSATRLAVSRVWGGGLLRGRRLAVGVGLLGAAAYALLAGLSLPTQRALVMVGTLLFALGGGRRFGASQRLLMALVLVLLIDPLAPRGAGFWLSFTATGVLLYLFCGRLQPPGRARGLLGAQGAVFVGLAPPLAFYFQQVPWLAPLVNLIAIPYVSLLVLPLALAALLVLALAPGPGSAGLGLAASLLEHGMAGLALIEGQWAGVASTGGRGLGAGAGGLGGSGRALSRGEGAYRVGRSAGAAIAGSCQPGTRPRGISGGDVGCRPGLVRVG